MTKESESQLAQGFISPEKELPSEKEVWSGVKDIVAERLADKAEIRADLRQFYADTAEVVCAVAEGKEEEGKKYRDYFDYKGRLDEIPSHRLLAIRRAEQEGILTMGIKVEEERALDRIRRHAPSDPRSPLRERLEEGLRDSFRRHLDSAMAVEVRLASKQKADREAISVFAKNLRDLLLAPPLGGERVIALDPGLRTGCKLTVISETGRLLEDTVIYPLPPREDIVGSLSVIAACKAKHGVRFVAIGNGTGGREVFDLMREAVSKDPRLSGLTVVSVNEAGASVYSASPVAREEFPDKDVTVRGAVSIGRRLQDPLAELVKIDPKSIGVGQYQHDVDQKALKESLDTVVVSCVNQVGVELNTASKSLLSYVSGLSPARAERIVAYRDKEGPFKTRKALLDVPSIGPKTFEQCAGFLRIRGGEHPLDNTGVHPERYKLVEGMAKDLGLDAKSLVGQTDAISKIKLSRYVNDDVGLPTLEDIKAELQRPGLDPRKSFEAVSFDVRLKSLADVQPGMVVEGVVTNATRFGIFVDIGVHRDGLVHVSELAWNFIEDATTFAKVGQRVKVKVLEVDRERERLSLSIKQTEPAPVRAGRPSGPSDGRPREPERRDDRSSPRRTSAPPPPPKSPREAGGGNTLGRYLKQT